MRDIFTAISLVWCLYNTWELHHNFKQDKRSNILDQMTLKALKIQSNRLDKLEAALKIKEQKEYYWNCETLEACEDLIMFGDEKFVGKCFPEDDKYNVFDLVAKYGLEKVLERYVKYTKGEEYEGDVLEMGSKSYEES